MQGIRQISFCVVLISVSFATVSAAASDHFPHYPKTDCFMSSSANTLIARWLPPQQFTVWISIQHHRAEFCIQRHARKTKVRRPSPLWSTQPLTRRSFTVHSESLSVGFLCSREIIFPGQPLN